MQSVLIYSLMIWKMKYELYDFTFVALKKKKNAKKLNILFRLDCLPNSLYPLY